MHHEILRHQVPLGGGSRGAYCTDCPTEFSPYRAIAIPIAIAIAIAIANDQ